MPSSGGWSTKRSPVSVRLFSTLERPRPRLHAPHTAGLAQTHPGSGRDRHAWPTSAPAPHPRGRRSKYSSRLWPPRAARIPKTRTALAALQRRAAAPASGCEEWCGLPARQDQPACGATVAALRTGSRYRAVSPLPDAPAGASPDRRSPGAGVPGERSASVCACVVAALCWSAAFWALDGGFPFRIFELLFYGTPRFG